MLSLLPFEPLNLLHRDVPSPTFSLAGPIVSLHQPITYHRRYGKCTFVSDADKFGWIDLDDPALAFFHVEFRAYARRLV